PPGKISGMVPVVLPGGGCALPGLHNHPYIKRLLCFVGPRKRSAAGRCAAGSEPHLCRVAARA
ncbi:hypothetical protein N5I86_07225, partial [Klebsiella variicola]|nr:hypothetical protein [Klebsiella variicola]